MSFSKMLCVLTKPGQSMAASYLPDRELLAGETHHRFANSLQLLGASVAREATLSTSLETTQALFRLQSRCRALSLLHEHLSLSGHDDLLDVSSYLEALVNHLAGTSASMTKITYHHGANASVLLDGRVCQTLGLIVNELVTNALKHAFGPGGFGKVLVSVRPNAEAFRLEVSDDGVGFDPALVNQGQGLSLVRGLAASIGARCSMDQLHRLTAISLQLEGDEPLPSNR